jgi:hypothetical protein
VLTVAGHVIRWSTADAVVCQRRQYSAVTAIVDRVTGNAHILDRRVS